MARRIVIKIMTNKLQHINITMSVPRKRRRLVSEQQKKTLPLDDQIDLARAKGEVNDPLEGMTEEELDNLIRNLDWSSDTLDEVNVGEVKKYMRSKKFREQMRKAKAKLDKTNKDIEDAHLGWFAANVSKTMVIYGVSFATMLGALTKFNLWLAPSVGLEGMSFMEAVFISMSQTGGFMMGGPMGFAVSSTTSYGLAGGFRLGNRLAEFVDAPNTRAAVIRTFRRLFPRGPPPELAPVLRLSRGSVSSVGSDISETHSFGDLDSRDSFSDFGDDAIEVFEDDSVSSLTARYGSESSFSTDYSDATEVSEYSDTSGGDSSVYDTALDDDIMEEDFGDVADIGAPTTGEPPPQMSMPGDEELKYGPLTDDDVIFGDAPADKNLYVDDLEEDDEWGDYTDDTEEADDWGDLGDAITDNPPELDMVNGIDIGDPPEVNGWVRILDRPSGKNVWVREGTYLDSLDPGTRKMLKNGFKSKFPGEAAPDTVVSEMNGINASYQDIEAVKVKLRSFGVSTEGTPTQLRARIIHLDTIDAGPVSDKWQDRRIKISRGESVEDLKHGEGMDGPHDIYEPDYGDVADVGKPPVGGAPPTENMVDPSIKRSSFAESAIPPKSQNVASESMAGPDIPGGPDIPETGAIGVPDIPEAAAGGGELAEGAGFGTEIVAAGGEALGAAGALTLIGVPVWTTVQKLRELRMAEGRSKVAHADNSAAIHNTMLKWDHYATRGRENNLKWGNDSMVTRMDQFMEKHPETREYLTRYTDGGFSTEYDFEAFYGKVGVTEYIEQQIANNKAGKTNNQDIMEGLEEIRKINNPYSENYIDKIKYQRNLEEQIDTLDMETSYGREVGKGLDTFRAKYIRDLEKIKDAKKRQLKYEKLREQLLATYKHEDMAKMQHTFRRIGQKDWLADSEKEDLLEAFDKIDKSEPVIAGTDDFAVLEQVYDKTGGNVEVLDTWRTEKTQRDNVKLPDPDQELIDDSLAKHHLSDQHPEHPKNSAPKDVTTIDDSGMDIHMGRPTNMSAAQYAKFLADSTPQHKGVGPKAAAVKKVVDPEAGKKFRSYRSPTTPTLSMTSGSPFSSFDTKPDAGMAQHSGGIDDRVGQGGGEAEVEEPINKQHRGRQNPSLAVNNIGNLPGASDKGTRVTSTLNDPVTSGALPSGNLYSNGTRAPADTGERQAAPGTTFSTCPHLGPVGGGSSVFHTHDPDVAAPSYGHSLTSTKGYKANVVEQVAPGENTNIGQPPVSAPKSKFTIHDLRSIYAMDKSIPNFTILAQTANQNFMHSMMETSQLQ